jgi:hypothetical protein
VLRHDHRSAFIDRCNAAWLIEKNSLKGPREIRATWERDLTRAAAEPRLVSGEPGPV